MEQALAAVKQLSGSPHEYVVWEDVIAIFPQLTNDTEAELLFQTFYPTILKQVDSSICGDFTQVLSFSLIMHFMSLLLDGARRPTFDPDDFTGTSGPVMGISEEKVSVKFQGASDVNPWESDLSQTEFGQIFLMQTKAMRTIIGIDGNGNLWRSA